MGVVLESHVNINFFGTWNRPRERNTRGRIHLEFVLAKKKFKTHISNHNTDLDADMILLAVA